MTRRIWIALVVALGAVHALQYPLIFEDSFISYRYAANLAGGHGLVFNPGEHVEGFTSLLWILILAPFSLLGLDLAVVGPALSLAAGLALVGAVAREHLGAAVLVAASACMARYGASGMESTLYALLLCVGWLRVDRRSGTAALALALLCRPEAPVHIAVILAVGALVHGRHLLVRGLGLAALWAALMGARWLWFGHPFPNTFYAKDIAEASLLTGLGYAEGLLWLHLGALGLVGLVWARRWVALALAGSVLLTSVAVGGDHFPLYRFLLPAIPPLMLGLALLAERAHRGLVGVPAGWLVLAPNMVAPAFFGEGPEIADADAVAIKAQVSRDYEAIAAHLGERFPADTVLAMNAVGVIPYRTGMPTVDMLGLTDSTIAHRAAAAGGFKGHSKGDGAYVLGRSPRVVFVALPRVWPEPPTVDQVLGRVLPSDADLMDQPGFVASYELVVAPVEGGYTAFFLRTSAP